METKIEKYETVEEMEDEMEEILAEESSWFSGWWKLWTHKDDEIMLIRHGGLGNPWVHLFLAVTTAWWLLALPNLGYAGGYYFMNSYYLKLTLSRAAKSRIKSGRAAAN